MPDWQWPFLLQLRFRKTRRTPENGIQRQGIETHSSAVRSTAELELELEKLKQ
jgi:hypothetical protein